MQKALTKKFTKEELEFDFWKTNNEMDDQLVGRSVSARVARGASRKMVCHVALARYFRLMDSGRASLRGMFSVDDLRVLLDVNPQPWWHENLYGEPVWAIADGIYWNYIEGCESNPEIDELFNKVQSLNLLQRLALVDVLECAWRDGKLFDTLTIE